MTPGASIAIRGMALLTTLLALLSLASTPRDISGVVLHAETRAPLAGQRVLLESFGVDALTTVSDGDGRFSFSTEEEPMLGWRLRTEAASGWHSAPVVRVPDGATGGFELLVAPAATRPIHGRALQQGTGVPLAGLELLVEQRGRGAELVTTEHDGTFVTSSEFAEGRLSFQPFGTEERGEGRDHWSEFLPEHGPASPLEPELSVATRLELAVRLPVGYTLDDLRAVRLGAEETAAAARLWNLAFVRGSEAGGRPWVRFSQPKYSSVELLERSELYVFTADGYWGGRSRPIGPRAVAVELEPLGAIELTLRAPNGPAVLAGHDVRVKLRRVEDGAEATARVYADHPLALERLRPGRWVLSTGGDAFTEAQTEVEVLPGRTVSAQLRPAEALPAEVLTLRVVDANGDVPDWQGFRDAPSVSAAVRSEQLGRDYNVQTSAMCGTGVDAWFRRVERDGRMVLETTLGPLVVADYEVRLNLDGRTYEGPATVRPGEPAVFTMHAPRFGFRVRSAATGEPVAGYRVVPAAAPGAEPRQWGLSELPLEVSAPGQTVHALDVERSELGAWCLVAPGYRRAYGTQWDFRQETTGGWAEVELEPGYGVRLMAHQGERERVVGARITFDGREFRTGSGGATLLTASEPPRSQPGSLTGSDPAPVAPRLSIEGWRIVAGNVAPDGSFDPEAHLLEVTLERLP